MEDIAKGKVDVAEIDHFIAHEDMVTELKPLLGEEYQSPAVSHINIMCPGVLREKMPKKIAGTVGTNLDQMVGALTIKTKHNCIVKCPQVKTFGHGMSVSVVKPKQTLGMAEDPSFAFCELQVVCIISQNKMSTITSKKIQLLRNRFDTPFWYRLVG